jgi:hypothetical protein
MARFEIRTGVYQRGLGPPAWRRALGITIMIVGAICAVIAMVSIGGGS